MGAGACCATTACSGQHRDRGFARRDAAPDYVSPGSSFPAAPSDDAPSSHRDAAMKARFDAGTDVAMIGAWDAQRGAQPFSADEYRRLSDTLDADAAEGHVFVVYTGADGGGPVDVYIDEPIPGDLMGRLTPVGDECVLALPSGSLDVDGVEH